TTEYTEKRKTRSSVDAMARVVTTGVPSLCLLSVCSVYSVVTLFLLASEGCGRGDFPAGEHRRQLARLGQLVQRLLDGGFQVPVGLANRGADREAVGGIAVEEPELIRPATTGEPMAPRGDHVACLRLLRRHRLEDRFQARVGPRRPSLQSAHRYLR